VGANTSYYVQVVKPVTEWIEVNAATSEDAIEETRQLPDVMYIRGVKHWSEYEEVDGC